MSIPILKLCPSAQMRTPLLMEGIHIKYNDRLYCVDYHKGFNSPIIMTSRMIRFVMMDFTVYKDVYRSMLMQIYYAGDVCR